MNTGIYMADTSSWIKYPRDYGRPFISCKPNEEWPHIALPYYNERETELLYIWNG